MGLARLWLARDGSCQAWLEKTRELRRRMRDRPPGGGVVIEGEVIREVDSERRER